MDRGETVQTYVSKQNPDVKVQAVSWTGRNLKEMQKLLCGHQIVSNNGRLLFIRRQDQHEVRVQNGAFVYITPSGIPWAVSCSTFLSEYVYVFPAKLLRNRRAMLEQFASLMEARVMR